MTMSDPAEILDDLHQLRVEGRPLEVDELAEEAWRSFVSGQLTSTPGIAAVCQEAFISAAGALRLPDAGEDHAAICAKAQLWHARSLTAAVQTGDLRTASMLLLPLAFQANDLGHTGAALGIMDELGRIGELVESEEVQGKKTPGVPLVVIRRSQLEKRGYLLWRQGEYAAALDSYEQALDLTTDRPRDALRVEAGRLLASLGVEELESGAVNAERAATQLADLAARAEEQHLMELAGPLRRNAERVAASQFDDVQDLEPVETESKSSTGG